MLADLCIRDLWDLGRTKSVLCIEKKKLLPGGGGNNSVLKAFEFKKSEK